MSLANTHVWREVDGEFQLVGTLSFGNGSPTNPPCFNYAEEYLRSQGPSPISLSLPLRQEPFDATHTRNFFIGLLPEGRPSNDLMRLAHIDKEGYLRAISLLNDESAGALVFGQEEPSWSDASYKELDPTVLRDFATQPSAVAVSLGMRTRRSLAGAQPKMGLYHTGNDVSQGWFVPSGVAPTTHIVKNSNTLFPGDAINEALCMATARANDLPAANTVLIPMNGTDPLLAIERFDRSLEGSTHMVSGLPAPLRLHQEDICQATGMSSELKYEPSGASYANYTAKTISRHSSEAFPDIVVFFYALCFDYIVGNCDNHLKNFSLLRDPHWGNTRLSPLYDIANTTLTPQIERLMGVSFGGNRVIDDVAPQMIIDTGELAGLSKPFAWNCFCEIAEDFTRTLGIATEELVNLGFPEVREHASRLAEDAEPRRNLANRSPL